MDVLNNSKKIQKKILWVLMKHPAKDLTKLPRSSFKIISETSFFFFWVSTMSLFKNSFINHSTHSFLKYTMKFVSMNSIEKVYTKYFIMLSKVSFSNFSIGPYIIVSKSSSRELSIGLLINFQILFLYIPSETSSKFPSAFNPGNFCIFF